MLQLKGKTPVLQELGAQMGLLLQKSFIGLENLVRDRLFLHLRLRDLNIDCSEPGSVGG